MKKIIQGKVCDTATAKELGSYEYSYPSQFNWYRETLYRSKSGVYFIHGEGNAASPYAEACALGGSDPGQKIRLLSSDAARAWAEEKLNADEYVAAFGDPEKVEKAMYIVLPKKTRDRLEALKRETGMTFSEIINDAIAAYQSGT